MAKDIVQRIRMEGAEEIRSTLKDLGQEGEAAAKKLDDVGKVSGAPTTQLAASVSSLRNELTNAGAASGILRDGLANIGITGQAATFTINALGGVLTALNGAALAVAVSVGAVATAALLAAPALLRLGREAGTAVDQLVKTAANVGTTAEKLQAYSRGAAAAGVESDKLADGLKTIDRAFGKALLDADKKTEQVTAGFKRISLEADRSGQTVERSGDRVKTTYEALGVTITRFSKAQSDAGKSTDDLASRIRALIGPVAAGADRIEIFNKLVEKLGAMPNDAKRRALIDSLGISGLAEAVEASAKKIGDKTQEMNANFRKLGDEQKKAADEGKAAADRLSANWNALKLDFGSAFTPFATWLDNTVADSIAAFGRINKAATESGVGAGFLESFRVYAAQLGFVFVDPTLRAFNLIKTAAELAAPGISQTFSNLWTTIVDLGGQAWARIPEIFSAQNFAQIWADITAGATATWEAIANGAGAVGARLQQIFSAENFSQIWADIVAGAGAAWTAVKDGAAFAWDAISSGFSSLVESLKSLWEGFTSFVSSAFESVSSFVSSLVDRVLSAVRSIASSIASLFSAASSAPSGDEPSTMEGFAGGGHVRGRGTETSDSILAWLSNNEFVMRGAAVRKYGLGILHAINSLRLPRSALAGFAAGGLVSAPAFAGGLPAFANGGVVDAFTLAPRISTTVEAPAQKALAPLTLQIGGETIGGLYAGEDSIGRLSRVASRQRLVSTGRKPGWNGV